MQSTSHQLAYCSVVLLTYDSLWVTIYTVGGGAAAQSGTVAGQTTAADMVKRRADEDGDGQEAEAATKIQATFRGYKARRELSQEDHAAAKIQAGFRGYRVRKEMKTGPGVSESAGALSAGSVESAAATKIQAGVRGFLVRRRNLKEEKAATKIQAGFRGYHTRKQQPADQ